MYRGFRFSVLNTCLVFLSFLSPHMNASDDDLPMGVVADLFGRQILQVDIDSCHLHECMLRRLQTELVNGYIDVHGLALSENDRIQFLGTADSQPLARSIRQRLERSLAQRQNQLSLSRDKLASLLSLQLSASRERLEELEQQQNTSPTFQFNLSRLATAIAAQESFLSRSNWEALERYRLHKAIDELQNALSNNIDPAKQFMVKMQTYRRFSEHLHKRYGGYVSESMFGPEPVEAMIQMMKTERSKGRIQLFTPLAQTAFEQLLIDLKSSLNMIRGQCSKDASRLPCSTDHRLIYH